MRKLRARIEGSSDRDPQDVSNKKKEESQPKSWLDIELPEDQSPVSLVDREEFNALVASSQEQATLMPNLLEKSPKAGQIVGMGKIKSAQERFILLGGLDGFLRVAVNTFNANLDIKTFSQLIHCIENTREAEDDLISRMASLSIQPDIDFFNQLLRRRVQRKDYRGGKGLMSHVHDLGLIPNIQTHGCLAMCCCSPKDIFDFLREMKGQEIRPNLQIMTSLIRIGGMKCMIPGVVTRLLKTMDSLHMKPDKICVETLERFNQQYRKQVLAHERGKPCHFAVKKELERGAPDWREFGSYYYDWLRRTDMILPEHPWDQYLTQKDIEKMSFKSKYGK